MRAKVNGNRSAYVPHGRDYGATGKSLNRVKRRGRHAPLPRKAVERRIYVAVRLARPIFERLIPAKANHGRNNQDFNEQSSHNLAESDRKAVPKAMVKSLKRRSVESLKR